MERGSLQVSNSELSAPICSIMREEIWAAFDRLQPQLDALKVELGEVEEGLAGRHGLSCCYT